MPRVRNRSNGFAVVNRDEAMCSGISFPPRLSDGSAGLVKRCGLIIQAGCPIQGGVRTFGGFKQSLQRFQQFRGDPNQPYVSLVFGGIVRLGLNPETPIARGNPPRLWRVLLVHGLPFAASIAWNTSQAMPWVSAVPCRLNHSATRSSAASMVGAEAINRAFARSSCGVFEYSP